MSTAVKTAPYEECRKTQPGLDRTKESPRGSLHTSIFVRSHESHRFGRVCSISTTARSMAFELGPFHSRFTMATLLALGRGRPHRSLIFPRPTIN